jgi:long-chain acyl-CoA synthetase
VELMMDLEEKLNASIDETAFSQARTIADLSQPRVAGEETSFPTYNRRWAAKLIRGIALEGILLPITKIIARRKVSGTENLEGVHSPVIFAANHQSHLDTPIILASLPSRWRRKMAPAMWKEYFEAHFHPERRTLRERWPNSLLYFLATLLFAGFPIPQRETGARESIRYMGELAEEGWSILIFPEGERVATGEIGRFLPGVGMIASRLHLFVVPIRLRGVDRILPRHAKTPHPGSVEVNIGRPIELVDESYSVSTQRIEEAIRNL